MKLTNEERTLLSDFAWEFDFCWACGIGDGHRDYSIDYWRNLEIHHIVGGAGRKHVRENLCRLCKMCHDLYHGARIKHGESYLPNLSMGNILWLKEQRDALCLETLVRLKSHNLPDVEEPDGWFMGEFERRQF